MSNYSPTLEYNALMDAYRTRKFTKNDIKSFVYKIFSMYERVTCTNVHKTAEDFNDYVADDIYVNFPDYKIRTKEQFKEWHKWIHDQLKSDDHEIENVDVEFLANGKYQAHFFVRWRADFKDGRFNDLLVEQMWVMREESDKEFPVIERYLAGLASNIEASTARDINQ